MDSVFEVQAVPLLKAIADTLKKNPDVKLPENHDIIKTGSGRKNAPHEPDWFYVRMAAIIRQVMCKGKISLSGLSYRFGNRKNRGVRPSKFARGSKFVIASAIAQLEAIGWIQFNNSDSILTETGKEVLGELIEKVKAN